MKLVRWVVRLVLLILFVVFAVANRHAVTVSFDPLPLSYPVPLFLVVFAAIFVGFLAGGGLAWMRGGSWRRRAREAEKEQRQLNQDALANSAVTPSTGGGLPATTTG